MIRGVDFPTPPLMISPSPASRNLRSGTAAPALITSANHRGMMIFKTLAEQGQAITADHERHRQSKQTIKNRHIPTSIRPEMTQAAPVRQSNTRTRIPQNPDGWNNAGSTSSFRRGGGIHPPDSRCGHRTDRSDRRILPQNYRNRNTQVARILDCLTTLFAHHLRKWNRCGRFRPANTWRLPAPWTRIPMFPW